MTTTTNKLSNKLLKTLHIEIINIKEWTSGFSKLSTRKYYEKDAMKRVIKHLKSYFMQYYKESLYHVDSLSSCFFSVGVYDTDIHYLIIFPTLSVYVYMNWSSTKEADVYPIFFKLIKESPAKYVIVYCDFIQNTYVDPGIFRKKSLIYPKFLKSIRSVQNNVIEQDEEENDDEEYEYEETEDEDNDDE